MPTYDQYGTEISPSSPDTSGGSPGVQSDANVRVIEEDGNVIVEEDYTAQGGGHYRTPIAGFRGGYAGSGFERQGAELLSDPYYQGVVLRDARENAGVRNALQEAGIIEVRRQAQEEPGITVPADVSFRREISEQEARRILSDVEYRQREPEYLEFTQEELAGIPKGAKNLRKFETPEGEIKILYGEPDYGVSMQAITKGMEPSKEEGFAGLFRQQTEGVLAENVITGTKNIYDVLGIEVHKRLQGRETELTPAKADRELLEKFLGTSADYALGAPQVVSAVGLLPAAVAGRAVKGDLTERILGTPAGAREILISPWKAFLEEGTIAGKAGVAAATVLAFGLGGKAARGKAAKVLTTERAGQFAKSVSSKGGKGKSGMPITPEDVVGVSGEGKVVELRPGRKIQPHEVSPGTWAVPRTKGTKTLPHRVSPETWATPVGAAAILGTAGKGSAAPSPEALQKAYEIAGMTRSEDVLGIKPPASPPEVTLKVGRKGAMEYSKEVARELREQGISASVTVEGNIVELPKEWSSQARAEKILGVEYFNKGKDMRRLRHKKNIAVEETPGIITFEEPQAQAPKRKSTISESQVKPTQSLNVLLGRDWAKGVRLRKRVLGGEEEYWRADRPGQQLLQIPRQAAPDPVEVLIIGKEAMRKPRPGDIVILSEEQVKQIAKQYPRSSLQVQSEIQRENVILGFRQEAGLSNRSRTKTILESMSIAAQKEETRQDYIQAAKTMQKQKTVQRQVATQITAEDVLYGRKRKPLTQERIHRQTKPAPKKARPYFRSPRINPVEWSAMERVVFGAPPKKSTRTKKRKGRR